MKIFKIIITVVLSSVLILQMQTAFAATYFSDGVYTFEKTESETAVIVDCTVPDGDLTVPEKVLGYPVTGIGDYVWMSSGVQSVILPDSVTSIGAYAFAQCSGLLAVTLPRFCESIADNAFWNSPNVTIRCFYGSAADTYAKNHALSCEYLDEALLGDADGDGYIRINDVTTIQRHIAELDALEGVSLLTADADQTGSIEISDATTLQAFLAEYDVTTPIGDRIDLSI